MKTAYHKNKKKEPYEPSKTFLKFRSLLLLVRNCRKKGESSPLQQLATKFSSSFFLFLWEKAVREFPACLLPSGIVGW